MTGARVYLLLTAWLLAIGSLKADPGQVLNDILIPIYPDPPGIGFNDPRPVERVPGNPGTTLGEQRRYVFERGLSVIASHIDSSLPIRIEAYFQDMGCPAPGEGLPIARGGMTYYVSYFPDAPLAGVNYPAPIAAHLGGRYPYPDHPEAHVFFNVRIDDEPDCHPSFAGGFWYGLGEVAPSAPLSTPFISLVLHELAHGLGIQVLTNHDTRVFLGQLQQPDLYSHFVYSTEMDLAWHEMTPAQRRASSTSGHPLAWNGDQANVWAANTQLPPPRVFIGEDRGPYPATIHGHRPFLPLEGLSAPLTVARNPVGAIGIDGVVDDDRYPDDACEPLDNAEAAAGSIVLIRRGGCFFGTKWRHAQDAGALALLVGDSYDPGESGAVERNQWVVLHEDLRIPLWIISRSRAEEIFADPPDTVLLGYDLSAPALGTRDGLLGLESSLPSDESNVVHTTADLLPLPFISAQHGASTGNVSGQPDLVVGMLHDLGWGTADSKQKQWTGSWFDPSRSGEGCQLTLEADDITWILTCFFHLDGEQLWMIGNTHRQQASMNFDPMVITRGTGYGSAFNPDEVEIIPWGRIEIDLYDCNHAQFRLRPSIEGFEASERILQKIVAGNCLQPVTDQPGRERSGNFFKPERSGEGIQVSQEADGESLVLTWYSYEEGKQLWTIGDGRFEDNDQVATFSQLYLARGGQFGSEFDPEEVELIPFGSAELEYLDCNNVMFRVDSALETYPGFERGMTRIVQGEC